MFRIVIVFEKKTARNVGTSNLSIHVIDISGDLIDTDWTYISIQI